MNKRDANAPFGPIDQSSDEWRDCERLIRRFEKAWQSDPPPEIEAFLPEEPHTRDAVLLELIHVDLEFRQKRGQYIRLDSYLDRFPQLAGQLSSLSLHADTTALGRRSRPDDPTAFPNLPGFEFLEVLGRGGMGIVYLAHQTALKRLVAVKMIRSRGADAEELARFRTEIEAAARLTHPQIVQIYEVGEHAGQPYCVLEYVAGGSLDRAVQGQPQPPVLAARLVHQLALTLQHAHDRGIIHRDLKPANVLLQRSEVRGQKSANESGLATDNCPLTTDTIPKIADFGLARQLSADAVAQTQTGVIVGTPAYMSPEQAAGQSRACGPATDIYSLGVILYELLTGRPPHQGASVLDTLQQVRSQDPVAPRALLPKIPRDLNTICLKCLHKEPSRRYKSGSDLAADLDAFLDQRPIAARPVGLPQRTVLAARRRPLVAALLATVCLVTVLGLSAAVYQWQQTSAALAATSVALKNEQNERTAKQIALGKAEEALKSEQAERTAKQTALGKAEEALKNEQTERTAKEAALAKAQESLADTKAFSRFVVDDVLAAARPTGHDGGLGIDVTVREALDMAGKNLATRFAGQPRAEAIARLDLGETYTAIGEYAQAFVHLQRAATLRRESIGPDDVATIEAEDRLGTALRQQGKHAEGIAIHESLRERCERLFGPESRATLAVLYSLVNDYDAAGREEEALRLSRDLLAKSRIAYGDNHQSTLKTMHQQAALLSQEGHLEEALPLIKEAYAGRLKLLGSDDTDTVNSLNNLAGVYKKLGQTDEALALFEQNLEQLRAKLGPEHLRTLMAMTNVAQTYGELGRLKEAVELDERAQRIALEKLGPYDPRTLTLSRQLANTYERAGRDADALPILEEVYKQRQKVLGPDHTDTLLVQGDLALAYRTAGRREDAVRLAEETYRSIRERRGDSHARTLWAMNGLALAYKSSGRGSEALPLYEAIVKNFTQRHGAAHPNTLTVRNNLGGAYFAVGRIDDAIQLQLETIDTCEKQLGPSHPTTLIVAHNLGITYQQAKRNDEALASFRRAYEGRAATLGPDHTDTLESMFRVGYLLYVRQELDAAKELFLDCQRRLAANSSPPPLLTKNVANILEAISKNKPLTTTSTP